MDSISSSDEDYEDEEEIKKGGEKGKSIAAADLNGIKKKKLKRKKKGSESKKEVLKSHEDIKSEEDDDRSMLKITPNVTITPKQRDSAGPYPVNSSVSVAISKDSPWFSILPMGKPMLENPSIPSTCEDKTAFSAHQFLHNFHSPSPHIEMLENKGWWRITSTELLRTVEYSLHPRGCREQGLLSNLKKCVEALVHHHYDGSKNPLTIGDEIEFELIEALKSIDENGVPKSDEPGKWNREVALRVEKYILEQVEALEDKVAAASMQVPGWKLPNREDIDERKFRPSCIKEDEIQEYGSLPDAITEAKERLLDLEQNIERRYLKTPLGFGNNEPTLQTITSCRTTMNSSKTPIEENNIENGKNHPDEDENGVESDDENCNKKDSDAPEKEVLPRGLQIWREGGAKGKKCSTVIHGLLCLRNTMKIPCYYATAVIKGDWYCFECINKATGIKHCLVCEPTTQIVFHRLFQRVHEVNGNAPPVNKEFHTQIGKKYAKKAKFIAADSLAITDNEDSKDISDNNQNPSSSPALNDSSASSSAPNNASEESQRPEENSVVQKPPAKKKKNSEEAWPFLYPVNTKQFPTYRKVIKNPMDIATIKRRLESGIYRVRDDFCNDVRQIFANCEIFNEDDSPIGPEELAGELRIIVGKQPYQQLLMACTSSNVYIKVDSINCIPTSIMITNFW
ncbi:unnamed protein product [Lepeophtheirus salmonis]|uniref:(salmon louse) hypothetical protein n=1 Tax=Lepeophtheirus salmonis TaxID=72036 RepID=A0A7R8CZ82_LEPSM|nr:unnamed protein product [Lepeophtheirus salmonis]CAF2973228.1 unnamed protein product [Lepeophtheirus salmonis]